LNTRTNSNSKYILTVALLAALILVASAAGAAALHTGWHRAILCSSLRVDMA